MTLQCVQYDNEHLKPGRAEKYNIQAVTKFIFQNQTTFSSQIIHIDYVLQYTLILALPVLLRCKNITKILIQIVTFHVMQNTSH